MDDLLRIRVQARLGDGDCVTDDVVDEVGAHRSQVAEKFTWTGATRCRNNPNCPWCTRPGPRRCRDRRGAPRQRRPGPAGPPLHDEVIERATQSPPHPVVLSARAQCEAEGLEALAIVEFEQFRGQVGTRRGARSPPRSSRAGSDRAPCAGTPQPGALRRVTRRRNCAPSSTVGFRRPRMRASRTGRRPSRRLDAGDRVMPCRRPVAPVAQAQPGAGGSPQELDLRVDGQRAPSRRSPRRSARGRSGPPPVRPRVGDAGIELQRPVVVDEGVAEVLERVVTPCRC